MSTNQFEVGATYQIATHYLEAAKIIGCLTFPETRQFKCHYVDENGFCWSKDVLWKGELTAPEGTCCGHHNLLNLEVFTLVIGHSIQ